MHYSEHKGFLRAHVYSKLNFQVHDVFWQLSRNPYDPKPSQLNLSTNLAL